MSSRSLSIRWALLILCGAVAGLVAWLMVVQIALVFLTPFGTWQKPAISKVRVVDVYRDAESQFTDFVNVLREGEARDLVMLKKEAARLKVDDEVWILDNYFVTTTRPGHFRLTPQRLLLEFPQPLLILALFGIWKLRRAIRKAEAPDPNLKRTVLTDDFHARAQRFSRKEENPPRMNTDEHG